MEASGKKNVKGARTDQESPTRSQDAKRQQKTGRERERERKSKRKRERERERERHREIERDDRDERRELLRAFAHYAN